MISEGEKEEIKSLLKVGRKRTLSFGVCLGEEPEETVFVMHRRTLPRIMGQQARAEGNTARIAKGLMEVDGRVVKLCCEGKVPMGLAKNLKKYLKLLKMTMTVQIVDEVAPLTDDTEEEEPEPAVEAAEVQDEAVEAAPDTPDVPPEQAHYEALAAPMASQIEGLKSDDDPKAKKLVAIWDLAVKRADTGDYKTAIKALTSVSEHL
ncbi:hypothetical protein Z946_1656 [Sulfitobacter noctilucicola]|uniref:Uncharacterized protein n=1 Tax=Sulfitobacter noctilucicola TaxID=1342301 RepID=A0A7W6M5D2_9RHOB|nr:hypothetical protein [Sulfitobacter noctilucicola]KIN62793.1 hypothetical protein Z946_1656 [Sulfitobacter noctilucicola]MBB4172676.1 hypothetical protein [Sulfitobacter noctilucicola]